MHYRLHSQLDPQRQADFPISSAELAYLQERERIELPVHWKPWFSEAIETNGWGIKPSTLEIMEEACFLPGNFHAGPADRILNATARRVELVPSPPTATYWTTPT